jgi:hypothetical protein
MTIIAAIVILKMIVRSFNPAFGDRNCKIVLLLLLYQNFSLENKFKLILIARMYKSVVVYFCWIDFDKYDCTQ